MFSELQLVLFPGSLVHNLSPVVLHHYTAWRVIYYATENNIQLGIICVSSSCAYAYNLLFRGTNGLNSQLNELIVQSLDLFSGCLHSESYVVVSSLSSKACFSFKPVTSEANQTLSWSTWLSHQGFAGLKSSYIFPLFGLVLPPMKGIHRNITCWTWVTLLCNTASNDIYIFPQSY